MNLVLIGYMGSGKSTVGKQLAIRLGYKYLDLDDQIELEETKSISTIFLEKGEIYFRKKENQMVKHLINTSNNFVLSTGGGTVCYGDTINFLISSEEVVTIYLKTSVKNLTNRLYNEKEKRPLISHISDKNDLNDFIRKHLFERSFYYNQAKLQINIDNLTVEDIVEKIVIGLF